MHIEKVRDDTKELCELQQELAEFKDQMVTKEDLSSLSHQISTEIRELRIHQERIRIDAQQLQKELSALINRTGLLKNEAYSTRERFTTIELKIESFCREWTKAIDHF